MNIDLTPESIILYSAALAALIYFLKTARSIGIRVEQINRAITDVSHQWTTNGQTGIRDTITVMFREQRAMRNDLARGAERFSAIEEHQRRGLERGEKIFAQLDEIKVEADARLTAIEESQREAAVRGETIMAQNETIIEEQNRLHTNSKAHAE
jgi:DNA-binding transcriptional MerR regulator